MKKKFLSKIRVLLLFGYREIFSILCVSLFSRSIKYFNKGIFETRMCFGKLLFAGAKIKPYPRMKGVSRIILPRPLPEILIRRETSDSRVFEQIFQAQEYREFINFIAHYTTAPIQTIIDGGANIGFATLYFKSIYPGATVVGLEPEQSNFLMLKENIALNKLNKVHLLQAGIWPTDTFLNINKTGKHIREWSFTVEESTKMEADSIRGYSIASIMKLYELEQIDILKLDIEGAERELFEDEKGISNVLQKTRFIALEIHQDNDKSMIELILRKNNFLISESGEYTIGFNNSFNKLNVC